MKHQQHFLASSSRIAVCRDRTNSLVSLVEQLRRRLAWARSPTNHVEILFCLASWWARLPLWVWVLARGKHLGLWRSRGSVCFRSWCCHPPTPPSAPPAPESSSSFGHGSGGGEELLLAASPSAADCDTDAIMSMFAGVPLPPATAGFSDGDERCERARARGGFRAIVDE
jgi:hypothetical protein